MHDLEIALITVGGSLLTGLLVAWATFRVARAERGEQRRRDLENAMTEFLSAITKAVSFLREMPHLDEHHPTVALAHMSAKISDFLIPGRTWVNSRRRMRRVLGEQPLLPAERVVDAAARLQVLDPSPRLAAAVETSLDYLIALGNDRSTEQLEKWSSIHKQLLDGIAATRARSGSTVVEDSAPSFRWLKHQTWPRVMKRSGSRPRSQQALPPGRGADWSSDG